MTFVGQCDLCPRPLVREPDSFTTGYGCDPKMGLRICFECCADQDRAYMRAHGRITLYLVRNKDKQWACTNWPGSLEIPVPFVSQAHGYGFGRRYDRNDFWFRFDGAIWHGVNAGDMQIARCKRTKRTKF